jgi:hypothetical protein
MSKSNNVIQPIADAWLSLLGDVNAAVETANADDAAGNWGADAWITLIHNLIDAQLRAYATFFSTSLSAAFPTTTKLKKPRPSAPVHVDPKDYPRAFRPSGFVRLGLPQQKLPDDCLRFYPPVLKANDTEFRVGLYDFDYVGANYTGTIDLVRTDAPAGAAPDYSFQNITLGL